MLDGVRKFLETHAMQSKTGAREFCEFEKSLHERLLEAEREIVADVMAASDVEADAIEVEERVHRRVLRSRQTYMTACGEAEVERWLYKDRTDPTAHALAALDLRVGIVEGFWTQRAAQQASWVVTQMTPKAAEELFGRVGNMDPSKSSLHRLPRALGERWETEREYEHVLREALVVRDGAVTVAVSIDGVLAPIDGGNPDRTTCDPTPLLKADCARARSVIARWAVRLSPSATTRAILSPRFASVEARSRRSFYVDGTLGPANAEVD